MTDNNPRMDPVGTVRTREGRTAVKAAMGDDSGKVSHVWLGITDGTVRVYHHADVRNWAVRVCPVSSPEGGDSTADDEETCCTLCPGPVRYLCTKPIGHDGDHVATRNEGIFIVSWPATRPASSVRDTAETPPAESVEESQR